MPFSNMFLWKSVILFAVCASAQDRQDILSIIRNITELSEFASLLDQDGLHQAFLSRQITFFAPTNAALSEYTGRRDENLLLNHMTNVAVGTEQLGDRIASLVTGNPPLWVNKDRRGIFVNQAKIVNANIEGRSNRGDQQLLHMIDSVLEPLVPIALREAKYFVNLDALQLLTKSSLYDLGGNRMLVFNKQAETNGKKGMFSVPGQHTFFIPVDSAFDVSKQLTGYDYSRVQDRDRIPDPRPKIKPSLVDARVIESHIVPYQLLFTSGAPTPEFKSVAWLDQGIKVNVSLQHLRSTDSYIGPLTDADETQRVVVRSNTLVGDRAHARGMVVARIVKGNIPVSNGVVHLIDKPLMIVSQTLHEYIMEEGRQPGNRLSKFAAMIRDKGGKFAEALLEARDGTLLAPSNQALEDVDQERLAYILGSPYLRAEMLGLHFVRERITSAEHRITATGDRTYSAPASLAANRVWFHFNPSTTTMTVEGRGVNATILEPDIGTVNGVIHVVDRVLGVPFQTIGERLQSDPQMSHMASLFRQMHMDSFFEEDPLRSPRRFTLVVPSNEAWERAEMHFTKAYNTILEGQFPNFGQMVLERHMKIDDKGLTFEELVEISRSSPRQIVRFMKSSIMFQQLGEFEFNAYKDNLMSWNDVQIKVLRPNIECTNGVIHLIDTVLIDDTPPWDIPAGDDVNGANVVGTGVGGVMVAVVMIIRIVVMMLGR